MADALPIRLIASDVDGTLIDTTGNISRENADAILEAQEKGVIFAIATGRFPENVYLLLQDHGISCPIIGTNGAYIVDEHMQVLSRHFMKPEAAKQVLQVLLAFRADYFIFAPGLICTARSDHFHHSELSQKDRLLSMGFTYFHGPDQSMECCQKAVQKFFICNNVPLAPIREALAAIPDILLTQSGPHNIEVMPSGVHKGQGVADLAGHYGIPLSQVMTLGDEDNDIPMLTAVGYGVAMGNASENTKATAGFVTETNEQSGLAKAIRRFAL